MERALGMYCDLAQERPCDLSGFYFKDVVNELIKRMRESDDNIDGERLEVGLLTILKRANDLYVQDRTGNGRPVYWVLKPVHAQRVK